MPLKLSPTQVAFNARGDGKFNKPFVEQVDFFQQKLNLPTERYDDILKSAHDRSFVVAGAMKADLLDDLRQTVDRAIAEGKSIQWFRKEFDNIVAKHGWTGWTGEGTKSGRDWRTRVIYRTNLSTSYAAGRWAQLNDPDLLKSRPYWKYVHNETVMHPRELHKAWSGLVLKYDDPWWQTHFPPNGWGCRCRITAVRESEYKGEKPLSGDTYTYIDKDGKKRTVLNKVDDGWDYAPGASVKGTMQPFIEAKAKALPKPIAEAFVKDVGKAKSFEAQPTVKAAAKWAVDNDLVDYADYGKVDAAVANDMNQSLFEHLQEFPELRKNQQFVGTCQAQFSRWHEQAKRKYSANLIDKGYDADTAKRYADKYVKKPINKGSKWMHSWSQPEVSGIAVNEKWGKDLGAFQRALTANVESKWHPISCDTVKSCVDHELGHQLDYLLSIRSLDEIKALFAKGRQDGMPSNLSGYAATEIVEFIAEAWAEALNNPSPRYYATEVARIIRDEYQKQFPARP